MKPLLPVLVLGLAALSKGLDLALPGASMNMNSFAIVPSKHMVVSPVFSPYEYHSLLGPQPVDSFPMFDPTQAAPTSARPASSQPNPLGLPGGSDRGQLTETADAYKVRVDPLGTGRFDAMVTTDNVILVTERVGLHEVASRFVLPAGALIDRPRVSAHSFENGTIEITLPKQQQQQQQPLQAQQQQEEGQEQQQRPKSIYDNLRSAFGGSGKKGSVSAAPASQAKRPSAPNAAAAGKGKASVNGNDGKKQGAAAPAPSAQSSAKKLPGEAGKRPGSPSAGKRVA